MLNDISRYFDDMFTIDNPASEKHNPDLYPAERQWNKANAKALLSWISPTTNAMISDFLSSIFPRLSGDVPRLPL